MTQSNRTLEELTTDIYHWGHAREIIINSTPLAQTRKTIEEVHELIEAATRFDVFNAPSKGRMVSFNYSDTNCKDLIDAINDLVDAIGDVFVTLCMVAGCAGLDITMCVEHAYNQIKDRRGYLREDGVFVKEDAETPAEPNPSSPARSAEPEKI